MRVQQASSHRLVTCRVGAPSASKPARIVRTRAAETQEAPPKALRQVSDLPVEEGWPILGMAPELVSRKFKMDDLFEKHGGPFVVNASFLGGYAVCIESGSDIIEAQTVRQHEMDMLIQDSFLRVVSNGSKEKVLSTEESRTWKAAMTSVLSPSAVMKLHVPLMIPVIHKQLQEATEKGQTLWHEDMRHVAFSVATRAVLGTLVSDTDCRKLYELFKIMASGALDLNYGLRDGIPGTPYNKSVQAVERIAEELHPILFEAVKDEDALMASDSILGRLMKSLKDEGADIMLSGDTDKKATHFCNEVIGLTFAGTDTTANTLAHIAVFMSKYPEWIERLWEEQQDLINTYGQEVTPQVVQKSLLAAAVGQEILRLGNANLLQQRRANSDTVAIVGSGEGAFDPTQWLKPGNSNSSNTTRNASSSNSISGSLEAGCPEAATESSGTSEASSICPFSGQEFKQKEAANMKKLVFGTGPRVCAGQNLAVTEITTVLVVLCREVKEIKMSKEEQDRQMAPVFPHPTGLPVELVAR